MSEGTRHPIQPLESAGGTVRFRKNAIVEYLAEGRLNELAEMDFPREDWEQLAQLIGYSLSGFGELSYVSDETYDAASLMADAGMDESSARLEALEHTLAVIRGALRIAASEAFQIHPDDLVPSGKEPAPAAPGDTEALREAALRCAEELEGMVEHEYRHDGEVHPALQHRYERDMETVHEVRRLATRTPDSEGCAS